MKMIDLAMQRWLEKEAKAIFEAITPQISHPRLGWRTATWEEIAESRREIFILVATIFNGAITSEDKGIALEKLRVKNEEGRL